MHLCARVTAAAAVLLASCAPATTIDSPRRTPAVVYSPPVRPGGTGGIILLRSPERKPVLVRMRSLEPPDPSPRRPTSEWLHGVWLQSATPDDLERGACISGTTMTYSADGTTSFFEGEGRWRLVGDRLTETIDRVFETADPGMLEQVGRPSTSRIRRVGPDEGAMLVDGRWDPMLRCRPGDIW